MQRLFPETIHFVSCVPFVLTNLLILEPPTKFHMVFVIKTSVLDMSVKPICITFLVTAAASSQIILSTPNFFFGMLFIQ